MAAGEGRLTRGRQRIPMRLIENQDDLYASFSKRRLGLFKKGSELSTLCGADVGIIVFSPSDNPFSFFSPNMETVVDRYRHPTHPLRQAARAIDAHTRARIGVFNRRLDELTEEKLRLKAREAQLEEAEKSRERVWWEEAGAVDALSKEQVKEWTAWFESFKSRVKSKIAQIQSAGAGSSSSAPHGGGAAPNPSFAAPGPTSYFGSAAAQFGGIGMPDPCGGGVNVAQYLLSSSPLDQFLRRTMSIGGASSSNQVFSPPFRLFMSPERPDPFAAGSSGGGGSEQYGFPTGYAGEAGGSGKGKEILELLPQSVSSDEFSGINFCLTPDYDPVSGEGENPCVPEEEEEAPASNQGEGGN